MPVHNLTASPGRPSKRTWRSIVGSFLLVALSVVSIYLAQRPLMVIDFINSYRFEFSEDAQQLAKKVGLTSSATSLFRASQPTLLTADQFNQNCHNTEMTMAILGCYSNRQIFVYRVDHPELAGVMETTVAHEFLHAAYDRLTPTEQQKINRWLQADYQRLKTEELVQRMNFYDRTEPGQIDNELHSILGTEFIEISPELKSYYQRYFTDRQLVVKFHQQYNSRFLELEAEASQLLASINNLEVKINEDGVIYETRAAELNQAIVAFNHKADSGQFASQFEFNQARQRLVARVDQLEALRVLINKAVDEYNQKIEAYNANLAKTKTLSSSLNSLTPAPSLE